MANKQPKDGHVSLNAQQVAFMHQIMESEDKHRVKFSKSPPRRKRNPILGEPTPRSTAREDDIAQLKRAQLDHTRKQMAITPTIAGRRRAAERKAQSTAIKTIATSTTVPKSANATTSSLLSSRSNTSKTPEKVTSSRNIDSRQSGGQQNGRKSGRKSGQPSSRNSDRKSSSRPTARPTGRSSNSEIGIGATDETQKVAQMRARKAWLERQLKEVEESLQAIPE